MDLLRSIQFVQKYSNAIFNHRHGIHFFPKNTLEFQSFNMKKLYELQMECALNNNVIIRPNLKQLGLKLLKFEYTQLNVGFFEIDVEKHVAED